MTINSNSKFGLVLLLGCLAFAAAVQANTPPAVTNVLAVQRPGTFLVDITFDLLDVDGDLMTVSAALSTDGGVTYPIACTTVTGDAGAGILSAAGLMITWDAFADFPGYNGTTCRIKVEADDGVSTVPPGFVYISPGTFMMGSPVGEPGRAWEWETLHEVTLTEGFYMGITEVTHQLWDQVMGSGTSTIQAPKNRVTWDSAVAFCNQLSIDEGLTPVYTINGPRGDVTWNRQADGYRLPTDAEWEYACRAGSQAALCNGPLVYIDCGPPLDPNLDQVGWYCGNSPGTFQLVGLKSPNTWGLYDMHGNLWEWCWDGFIANYETLPSVDPVYDGVLNDYRVLRGGSYIYFAYLCRSAYRHKDGPWWTENQYGFRIVRTATTAP